MKKTYWHNHSFFLYNCFGTLQYKFNCHLWNGNKRDKVKNICIIIEKASRQELIYFKVLVERYFKSFTFWLLKIFVFHFQEFLNVCNRIFSPYILETDENINLFYTFFPLCFSFIIKLSVIQHWKKKLFMMCIKSHQETVKGL